MANVESRLSEPVSRADIEERFRQFALRIIRLVDGLPSSVAGREIGRQALRSATSAAANYRVAGHEKSKADFIAKLGITEEAIDETVFGYRSSRMRVDFGSSLDRVTAGS